MAPICYNVYVCIINIVNWLISEDRGRELTNPKYNKKTQT